MKEKKEPGPVRSTEGYFAATLSPMLAQNKCLGMDVPFEHIRFPKLCSIKYNGVRGITCDSEWTSRSGKPLRMSPQVREVFQPILDYAIANAVVLDGEFNATPYNTSGETMSILAGNIPLPDDFYFKCFYEIPCPVWNTAVNLPMRECLSRSLPGLPRYRQVEHRMLHSLSEFLSLIGESKNLGLEGFVLLNPSAYYKHGRATIVSQTLLKFKYYSDKIDGKVVGLSQRRERRPGIPTKYGVLGKAEQVYTKDSFQDTDIAGCMKVLLEDGNIIHVPFPVGTSLEDRAHIYSQFGTGLPGDISGRWVCFRRLACEGRDKPIAIKGVEFRDDK